MTSNDIKYLLNKRFSQPSYAFFTEVGSSTGGSCRYADGIACSLWPSTGFEIQGFEIKISNQDFQNELKDPSKSDEIMRFCDRWWIVAPKGIINKEELPATWGLIEVRGDNKLFIKKQAPLLKAEDPTPGFIAMLLRRATEGTFPRSSLNKFQEEIRRIAEKRYKEQAEYAETRLSDTRKNIAEFEKASGINPLSSWRGGKEMGEAVNFVLDNGFSSIDNNVESAIEKLEKALEQVKVIQKFDKKIKS